jgi:hypothetical protein
VTVELNQKAAPEHKGKVDGRAMSVLRCGQKINEADGFGYFHEDSAGILEEGHQLSDHPGLQFRSEQDVPGRHPGTERLLPEKQKVRNDVEGPVGGALHVDQVFNGIDGGFDIPLIEPLGFNEGKKSAPPRQQLSLDVPALVWVWQAAVAEKMIQLGHQNPEKPGYRLSYFGMVPEADFGTSKPLLLEPGMAELEIEVAFEFGGMDQNGIGGQGFQFGGLVRLHPDAAVKCLEEKMGQRFRSGGKKAEVMVVGVPKESGDLSMKGIPDVCPDSS